jgi:hypothetical protein
MSSPHRPPAGWNPSWNLDLEVTPPLGRRLETDEELRERILYVAGESGSFVQRVRMAQGAALDSIAESYGLKRHV